MGAFTCRVMAVCRKGEVCSCSARYATSLASLASKVSFCFPKDTRAAFATDRSDPM